MGLFSALAEAWRRVLAIAERGWPPGHPRLALPGNGSSSRAVLCTARGRRFSEAILSIPGRRDHLLAGKRLVVRGNRADHRAGGALIALLQIFTAENPTSLMKLRSGSTTSLSVIHLPPMWPRGRGQICPPHSAYAELESLERFGPRPSMMPKTPE